MEDEAAKRLAGFLRDEQSGRPDDRAINLTPWPKAAKQFGRLPDEATREAVLDALRVSLKERGDSEVRRILGLVLPILEEGRVQPGRVQPETKDHQFLVSDGTDDSGEEKVYTVTLRSLGGPTCDCWAHPGQCPHIRAAEIFRLAAELRHKADATVGSTAS